VRGTSGARGDTGVTTRRLPWTDIVAAIGEERLAEVRSSLRARGTDDLDRDAFLLDPAALNLLRDLVPDDAPLAAVNAYGALLHMLYVSWARDWPIAPVEADRLREELARPTGLASRTPPVVCYVQLPERLVWAEGEPGQAHEPLDGIFVVAGPERLHALAVLGLRQDREGFTTMESELALPADAPSQRADRSAPFASMLPAGERARLHSVANPHELGALALLALAAAGS